MLEKLKNYVNTKEGKYTMSYVISSLIVYNLVPILGIMFPNFVGMYTFVLDLIIINPLYAFVSNLIISELNEPDYKVPVIIGILFLPTVFIFYNSSALVYVVVYIILGVIASFIGNIIYKKTKNKKVSS